jgi:hypothetical protein
MTAEITVDQIRKEREANRRFNLNIVKKIDRFIKRNPNSDELPKLYYQKAELYSKIYEAQGYQYELETAELYKKVIELDPNYPMADVAHYNIGYYIFKGLEGKRDNQRNRQFELGNYGMAANWPDSLRITYPAMMESIENFEMIYNNFQSSEYYPEALYWLGYVYFQLAIDASGEKRELYDSAIKYFTDLANLEGSPRQMHGYFMRGWAFYAIQEYDSAINDFSQILKTLEDPNNVDIKKQLELETVEMAAQGLVSKDFIEYEKYSKAASAALETFSALVEEDYGKQILNEAIDLKLQLNAPMQAIDLYNAYLQLYPISLEAPTYNDSIIQIYRRSQNRTRNNEDVRKLIRDEYYRVADTYRPDSLWYQEFKDKEINSQLALIRESIEKYASKKFYNEFVQKRGKQRLDRFAELLFDYAKFEPFHDQEGEKWMQNEGQRLVDAYMIFAGDEKKVPVYFDALAKIDEHNGNFPDGEKYFENEKSAFICAEQIDDILRKTIADEIYVDSLRNHVIDESVLDTMYVDASIRYEKILRNNQFVFDMKLDELIKVTYKRAEIYFKYTDYDKAYVDYEMLLTLNTDTKTRKAALTQLAEINRIRKNFLVAESFYRQAGELADAKEKDDYKNNAMAMILSNADSLEVAGSNHGAAEEYLRLAKEYSDPEKILPLKVKAMENYKARYEFDSAVNQILEIAAMKEDKLDKLGWYQQAWNMADSLMTDYKKGEDLRKQFIALYPASNEAFKIRIQIIKFYDGGRFDNKDLAAEMYLELHSNVREKLIDNGELAEASIYLLALQIYFDKEMDDLTTSMMLDFEKMYPKHEKSVIFLKQVALRYKTAEKMEKYKEMAAYIYKKYPEIDLVSEIAVQELKEIYAEIDTLYKQKKYDEMREQVKAYKDLELAYIKENVKKEKIHNAAWYENFEIMEENIKYENEKAEYMAKYDATIKKVEDEFLNGSNNLIFKVNRDSEIKRNFLPRLKAVVEKPEPYKKILYDLIREGGKYEITTEQKTHALFLVAECYKHTMDVLVEQVQKFFKVSKQYKKVEKLSVAQATKIKNQLLAATAKNKNQIYRLWLQNLIIIKKGFIDGKDYEDEWTNKTRNILIEKGVMKVELPIVYDAYDHIYINKAKPTQTLGKSLMVDSLWSNITVADSTIILDSIKLITVDTDYMTFANYQIIPEIIPYRISIDYYANEEKRFFFNGMPVDREVKLVNEIVSDSLTFNHYNFTLVKKEDFKMDNDLTFLFMRDTTNVEPDLFGCEVTIVYEKPKLEFHRSTKPMHIETDNSWLVKLNENVTIDSLVILDTTWTSADSADFSMYKDNFVGMESSPAEVIWHTIEDTNSFDTAWMVKEFEIEEGFVSGKLKFIGEKETSIWINGMPLVENHVNVYDSVIYKWMPTSFKEVDPNLFRKGKNQIICKVKETGYFGGLILEFDYIEKRKVDKPETMNIESSNEEQQQGDINLRKEEVENES